MQRPRVLGPVMAALARMARPCAHGAAIGVAVRYSSAVSSNPKVSLTVLDEQDWYRHVSLFGSVVKFVDDVNLADIDRLCLRYTRKAFANRAAKRVSAWIEPKGWHGWDDDGKLSSTSVRT